MDKGVVFAVAGSGKTTSLIASLDEARRFLLVTYTEANHDNLRAKVIERFGYVPSNIAIHTYFSFLHSFCYRPFLRSSKGTRGITFSTPERFPNYPLTDDRRYMTSGRSLYANRLAKFIEQSGLYGAVVARIEKYFDVFLVDEVQDFGGHDFNFLMAISAARLDMTFVGDFHQHTFDTSRDGNVNASLHADYGAYRKKFERARLKVDTESLKRSRRCSKSVCDFITQKIGIEIESHDERASEVRFENDPAAVAALLEDAATVKLFYKEHYKYGCFSQNWGASKGMDSYGDVCVVLSSGNVKALQAGSFRLINPETRNKLYVACSRARGKLTFVPESLLKAYRRT
tara:strand:- start:1159 stop:2190 length:1032 start_codon:yes stop_codon:yes gene_type:complete